MRLSEVSGVTSEHTIDPLSSFIQSVQAEESDQQGYLSFKRAFDFTVALILIVLSAPLMLIIALAVKLTSKGPVLFTQERVGQGGKPFTFMKFRSMAHNNDNSIHKEFMDKLIRGDVAAAEDENLPCFKMKDDPRITEFGHFIRKTSLDELPQLLNVLNGSMSLVGPRPPIPYEVKAYKSWHLQRLSVKPGITGLWQVSGRSSISFDEMVQLDIKYIENRSFLKDLKILFQTIPATLNTRTAA